MFVAFPRRERRMIEGDDMIARTELRAIEGRCAIDADVPVLRIEVENALCPGGNSDGVANVVALGAPFGLDRAERAFVMGANRRQLGDDRRRKTNGRKAGLGLVR